MRCNFQQTKPGLFVCNQCGYEAKTNAMPSRKCGQSLMQKAINVAGAAVSVATKGFHFVTPEQLKERKDICSSCISRNPKDNSCLKCGCNLGYKPQLTAFDCPDKKWPKLEISEQASPVPVKMQQTIPVKSIKEKWRGTITKKPWEYDCTAIIPVLEPDPSLELVIELLRLQTNNPYILLIDTGSSYTTTRWIESLRAPDVEVHTLRLNAVCHPSEPVSMALDVGIARAQTKYLFFTHSDCFLTKQTAIEELIKLADEHIVAGHQITERPYPNWQDEVGHTLLMVDWDYLQPLNIRWSMRQAMRTNGSEGYWPDYNRLAMSPNYPDTETNFNLSLQRLDIKPYFTGSEQNFQRNTDEWIDHVRSNAASKTYSPEYYKKSSQWLPSAISDAQARILEWQKNET